eukprot:RCo016853
MRGEVLLISHGHGVMLLRNLAEVLLQFLDDVVLLREEVFQLALHRDQGRGLQVTCSQNLPNLSVLFLQLGGQDLGLLLEHDLLEYSFLLKVVQGGLVPLVQAVTLLLHLLRALQQNLVFPRQSFELVLKEEEPLLGVLERLLVLLVVRQFVAQQVDLFQGLGQRLCEALVLLCDLKHQLLVVRLIALHVADLLLQVLDQLQVVRGNVIVVLADIHEGPVMLSHQFSDVVGLLALNLIDFGLALDLHLLTQVLYSLLVLHLHLLHVPLELLHLKRELLVVFLLHSENKFIPLELLPFALLLELPLVQLQVRLLCTVLLQLVLQSPLALSLQLRNLHLLLIQQMPELLLVYLHFDLVALVHLLDLAVFVAQLCTDVLQLSPGNLPEGVDLVPLQLKVVPELLLLGQGVRGQPHLPIIRSILLLVLKRGCSNRSVADFLGLLALLALLCAHSQSSTKTKSFYNEKMIT